MNTEGAEGKGEMRETAADGAPSSPLAPLRSGRETFEFLLRRMRLKADFPALSDSVSAINRLVDAEDESVGRLAEVLLKDFALTNKLLRLVNAAHYRQAGGGNISTVSRAIIVLGFDTVRNLALTVLLFEHLEDKANAQALKESFLRAGLAALIARAGCQHPLLRRQGEEAYICALFHDLGRLLTQYYFPEEYAEIERRMMAGMEGEAAATQVLGISFEELGTGIARHWGFPPAMVASMRRLPNAPLHPPKNGEEALRLISGYANELCEAIGSATGERSEAILEKIAMRFGPALGVDSRTVSNHLQKAFGEIREFAALLHVNLAQSSFARQAALLAGEPTARGEKAKAGSESATIAAVELSESGDEGASLAAEDVLAAGIRDLSTVLLEERGLNDVMRIVLETLYRSLGARRVALATRDAKGMQMIGRFGLGPDSESFVRRFRFPLEMPPADVFQLALARNADVHISNVDEAHISDKVPAWWRRLTAAKTFLLLPLCDKGRPLALIYAEKEQAGSFLLSERVLGLVKALRNQALLALRQTG